MKTTVERREVLKSRCGDLNNGACISDLLADIDELIAERDVAISERDAFLEGSGEWEESFHQAKALEKVALQKAERYKTECDAAMADAAAMWKALDLTKAIVDEGECSADEDCDHCLIIYHTINPVLERLNPGQPLLDRLAALEKINEVADHACRCESPAPGRECKRCKIVADARKVMHGRLHEG